MEDEKLSGRVIIDTILANMRQQVEELRYSRVVPAAYDVYIHGDDQQRFESLAHEIAAEAVRALQERLDALNRPSRLDGVRKMVRKPRLPFKKMGPWLVRITRDPEGAVPRGRALVVSQIALAGAESFEGQRTRRLATLSEPPDGSLESREVPRDLSARLVAGPDQPAAREETDAEASALHSPLEPRTAEAHRSEPRSGAESIAPVALDTPELAEPREVPNTQTLAVLAWEDETGAHRFRMTGPDTTVGRAVQGSTADVRLATLPDVSRVHVRLRYHAQGRRFSIEDLSLLGTTVNGQALVRGAPRDLPSAADIRLADAITVRFESEALP